MGSHGRLLSRGSPHLQQGPSEIALAIAERPDQKEGGWGKRDRKSTWAVMGPGKTGELEMAGKEKGEIGEAAGLRP